jgi:hypothetical protein
MAACTFSMMWPILCLVAAAHAQVIRTVNGSLVMDVAGGNSFVYLSWPERAASFTLAPTAPGAASAAAASSLATEANIAQLTAVLTGVVAQTGSQVRIPATRYR